MMEQINEFDLSAEEKNIAGVILSSVNDNGFLQKSDEKGMTRPISLDELLDNGKIKPADFEKIRNIIMHMDPIGVGSFDSREYLEVQAAAKFGEKSMEYRILHEFPELLEKKLFTKLSKELGVSFGKIQETIGNIGKLSMFPASGFTRGYPQYIVPDAYVNVDDQGVHLVLNDDYIPNIRLNKQYIDLYTSEEFKGKRILLSRDEKNFLRENIDSAKMLIENLRSRKEIIFKVILKIKEKQKDFFLKGYQYQIPLRLKDIADELNIHESTVSRVVRDKYIQTNKGMIALKSFFSSNVGNEDTSSKSVKEILKTFIEAEDKDDPLSDDRIVQIFKKKGINLSRRTVAKYRAEINIPPAFMRRNPK
jgi:RNA polymerase sigma-54 factor